MSISVELDLFSISFMFEVVKKKFSNFDLGGGYVTFDHRPRYAT